MKKPEQCAQHSLEKYCVEHGKHTKAQDTLETAELCHHDEKGGKLQTALDQYLEKELYPMHMPGHKRRCAVMPTNVLRYDFTEVSGTDDLHHAEGILKDAMERTRRLVGSDRTWYLVNGSTCGNLAGVSAIVPYDGEVIVARNCHRSVFHALELRHAHPHWLWPSMEPETGIFNSVRPEEVEALLSAYPNSAAVVLTSPSYEGVVSDIRSIAELCHRHDVPLMVDEAHGAHFGLVPTAGFPDSAVHQGADLSVQSAHKTLLGMTQTAYLHLRGNRISEETLEEKLAIFETSSPSYPLMLSLAGCTDFMETEGEACFCAWAAALHEFDEIIRPLRCLRVLCHGRDARSTHAFYDFDPSKLVVDCSRTSMTGEVLQDLLRTRFHYELEMAQPAYALAMTGPGDDFTELRRFGEALCTIDRELEDEASQRSLSPQTVDASVRRVERALDEESSVESVLKQARNSVDSCADFDAFMVENQESVMTPCDAVEEKQESQTPKASVRLPEMETQESVMAPCDAVEASTVMIPRTDALDQVSGEYVYSYPPGVPILVPGERITEKVLQYLERAEREERALRYSRSEAFPGKLACVSTGDASRLVALKPKHSIYDFGK